MIVFLYRWFAFWSEFVCLQVNIWIPAKTSGRYFDFLDALRLSFGIVISVVINDELNDEYKPYNFSQDSFACNKICMSKADKHELNGRELEHND